MTKKKCSGFGWAAAAALLLAGALALPDTGFADERSGYWRCEAGAWAAVGEPEHPAPEWNCGAPGDGQVADTEAKCEAAGGEWRQIGLYPEPVCVTPAADAGRSCQDGGECLTGVCGGVFEGDQWDRASAGETVVVAGACEPQSPVVGCLGMVQQGAVGAMLCID